MALPRGAGSFEKAGSWIVRAAAALGLSLTVLGAGPARAVTANFLDLGTFTTPSLSADGVIVTGSADVSVLALNGLGIVGGVDSTVVDFGEWLSFSFVAPEASDVEVHFNFLNALVSIDVEAFEQGGISLGTVTIDPTPPFDLDVSALFGGVPLESLTLTAIGSTMRVGGLSYTPVPEPSAGLLVAAGLGVCGVLRRRSA